MGGKSASRARTPGLDQVAALAFCLAVLLNPVFLPYGALFNAAFSPVATTPLTLSNFTLHNIHFVLFEPAATRPALNNTFILGAAAATIGTLLALMIGYATARQAITGHRLLGFLATAPIAIPGIVLGVALFLSYTRTPFILTAHFGSAIAFVTISSRAPINNSGGVPQRASGGEDASRILGATPLQSLRRITAPLLRSAVIATWCLIFVGVIRELSAAIILFTSETKVISVLIFDLNESGDLGAIAVLGILLLVITFTVVTLVNRVPGFGGGIRLRNSCCRGLPPLSLTD